MLHESTLEVLRTQDLMRLIPKGRRSVLDVGARDGFFSGLLTGHFERVVALDIIPPQFQHGRIDRVCGDALRLPFPDASFDCVLCTEVLEHIPQPMRAAAELARVARNEIIIGVPFRQDIRIGRVTCRECGTISPHGAT